jgi:hypothetical protein
MGSRSNGTANIHVMSAQPANPITIAPNHSRHWNESVLLPDPTHRPRWVVDRSIHTQDDVPTMSELGYRVQPSVPAGYRPISYSHLTGAAYAGSGANATLTADSTDNSTVTSRRTSNSPSLRNTALNTPAQNRMLEENLPTIVENTDVGDPAMVITPYPSFAPGPSTNMSKSRTLAQRADDIHDLTTLGCLPPQNPGSVGELSDTLQEVNELEGEEEEHNA